jgi:hypothetical protein
MSTDILAFIEDPGAANYMLPVIAALEARGVHVTLRTEGAAATYVARASTGHEEAPDALLTRLRPRAILVGTSENARTFGLALIDAAKAAGIPTVAALDSLANAARRFQGLGATALTHAPDLILVADDATAAAFAALGYPRAAIKICGHPQHDTVRDRAGALDAEGRTAVRRRVFGEPENGDRPVLVFASEVSTGIGEDVYKRTADYTLSGSGKYNLRTEIVIEEFLAAVGRLPQRPHLVLRLHPKNTREELSPFVDAFDDISEGGPGLDVVFAADAVAGMTSILLVEAMILGRPVLSLLPRAEERNLLSEILSGAIPAATTAAQIDEGLRAILQNPQARANERVTTNAAARAADAIMAMLK